MPSLYKLQQRLAVTATEAGALLFVAALLLAGLGVRTWQDQALRYTPDHYAALEADLQARSATLHAAAAAPDSAHAEAHGATPDEATPVAVVETGERRTPRSAKPRPVRMNLNTASERLLQRLPGIGPALAGRIVAYRDAHGDFAQPGHLVRVRGIGPKTFEKLAPYLFIEDAPAEATPVLASGG